MTLQSVSARHWLVGGVLTGTATQRLSRHTACIGGGIAQRTRRQSSGIAQSTAAHMSFSRVCFGTACGVTRQHPGQQP